MNKFIVGAIWTRDLVLVRSLPADYLVAQADAIHSTHVIDVEPLAQVLIYVFPTKWMPVDKTAPLGLGDAALTRLYDTVAAFVFAWARYSAKVQAALQLLWAQPGGSFETLAYSSEAGLPKYRDVMDAVHALGLQWDGSAWVTKELMP